MHARRRSDDARKLCSGPGRLCQALAVDGSLNGHSLDAAPFQLILHGASATISVGPRIGISKAVEKDWRFGLAGSPFLSSRM
jgi:DNA-3-methyladenine glycosylase